MNYTLQHIYLTSLTLLLIVFSGKAQTASNPIIYADVPDMSMIRVGNNYYMSSTTMHLSPGIPIMKSNDLINWWIVGYAYDTLENNDAMNLNNGKNAYGNGSWASSLRYHKGLFYVSTFSSTTGKTHIYITKNIEKGPWASVSFKPALHDHSLFFDDDGKVYMVYGSGRIMLAELNGDLSGIKPGTKPKMIINNAGIGEETNTGLPAEGSQLCKVNGKYYILNITWPKGSMRTVVIHRSEKITGPYEGRIALQDKGIAQGGLIDTPDGQWYAYLFRDYGSVGRIPYLVPVKWEDGWPILGTDGKVPDRLPLPVSSGPMPGIVASDEFNRIPANPLLPLVWQWNHNPDKLLWSLRQRPGYLRLITGRLDTAVLQARNTLTQRTFGPQCSAVTALDISGMKDGDHAGLLLLQQRYGCIGIKVEKDTKYVTLTNALHKGEVKIGIPPLQKIVYLKADCNFKDRADLAYFYYSLDNLSWIPLGQPLKMVYTLPHFMGYRFALFNYATKSAGGYTDFDFFRISDQISADQ